MRAQALVQMRTSIWSIDAKIYAGPNNCEDAYIHAKIYAGINIYTDANKYKDAKIYASAIIHVDANKHMDAKIHAGANARSDAKMHMVYGCQNLCGHKHSFRCTISMQKSMQVQTPVQMSTDICGRP